MKPTDFWNDKMTRQVPEQSPGAAPAPEQAPDLSFVPADFHVDGKPDLTKFTEHYQALVASDAQAKQKVIPETYDLTLPADMKYDGIEGLPADFKVEFKADDPAYKGIQADLAAFLKETGAAADAGPKAVQMLARYEAIKFAKRDAENKAHLTAEAALLGTPAQAQARLATVQRALQAKLPADQVAALQAITSSSKALMALEKLLSPTGLSAPLTTPQAAVPDNISPLDRLKLANARTASQAAR